MADTERFLPSLCKAMKVVHDEGGDITTESFVTLMNVAVRCFDYMGTVMHIAKHEIVLKAGTLHAVSGRCPTLREVVAADVLAGRATVKDSCARNLHRLACAIKFVRMLLEQFANSPTITVREAANKAYEQSLAPLHIYVVRTAVWAGMYMLPTREHFMTQLGETDESAIKWAKTFLECSPDVERQVMRLFNGISMPQGAASSHILTSLWGGGAPVQSQPA